MYMALRSEWIERRVTPVNQITYPAISGLALETNSELMKVRNWQ